MKRNVSDLLRGGGGGQGLTGSLAETLGPWQGGWDSFALPARLGVGGGVLDEYGSSHSMGDRKAA